MSTIHIQRLEDAGSDGWHLRFSCADKADFAEMIEQLKWEGCRWNPEAFGKYGGAWIVEHATLMLLKNRFDNLEQCLERVKVRKLMAEQAKARELAGIDRDINEVPF